MEEQCTQEKRVWFGYLFFRDDSDSAARGTSRRPAGTREEGRSVWERSGGGGARANARGVGWSVCAEQLVGAAGGGDAPSLRGGRHRVAVVGLQRQTGRKEERERERRLCVRARPVDRTSDLAVKIKIASRSPHAFSRQSRPRPRRRPRRRPPPRGRRCGCRRPPTRSSRRRCAARP